MTTTTTTTDWKANFARWQALAQALNKRAERLTDSRMDQAFALASTVGIPRDMCCLHNASIDDEMIGWCVGNPERLRVAKRANWMATEWVWEPSRKARLIIDRAWKRYCQSGA